MKTPEPNGRKKNRPARTPAQPADNPFSILSGIGRSLLAHPNTIRDLDPIARAALSSGARCSVLLVRSEARSEFSVEAAAGLEHVPERTAWLEAARKMTAWSVVTREAIQVEDFATDSRFEGGGGTTGSFACVPLVVFDEVIGALVVQEAGPEVQANHTPRDLSFLALLADTAAMAVQNGRLASRAARLEKKLKSLESEIARKSKLATVGEMTGAIVGELRQPVSAIAGFARRVARALPQGDLNREYLDVILSEAERLDRLVAEHLEMLSTLNSRLRLEDLNSVADECLRGLREAIAARKARCIKRLAPGLPRLLLDAEKIERVIRNIIQDLLTTVPAGGRIKIESKRVGESVQLIIAADGPRTPGDVLEKLFVPFRGQTPHGTGLAVTHQIVKEHGGELGVKSDLEWPTAFTLSLPIKTNEDRRRANERRKTPRDRRSKGPGRTAA